MATYSKLPLSGSVTGKRILVSATTSQSANPIHTAVAGTSSMDEIWLYGYNDATSSLTVSILWGGTVEPNDVIRTIVPGQSGRMLVVDGQILQNGLTVQAYCSGSNWVTIDGFVNRIVP